MSARRRFPFVLVVLLLLLAACSPQAPGDPSVDASPSSVSGSNEGGQETVGIIALGHSGLTGEGSDPARPGRDVPENSWATGTAPEVNSIYQRLIAVHPDAAGQVANAARAGAPVTALVGQAKTALATVPYPELVIIQTMDNDIRCDGSDPQHVEDFGNALAEALQFIADASPGSHILVVSQQGRPATFAEAMTLDDSAWPNFVGNGICDLFNSDGSFNQEHIAALTAIIEGYEAEQERVCAAVQQCSTDGGVFSGYTDDIADWVVGDWNHLNITGLARRAELIWPVIADLLGLN